MRSGCRRDAAYKSIPVGVITDKIFSRFRSVALRTPKDDVLVRFSFLRIYFHLGLKYPLVISTSGKWYVRTCCQTTVKFDVSLVDRPPCLRTST